MKLSIRHKLAAIEPSSFGVGVSTSARIVFRKHYASHGIQNIASMRNADVNDVIASDFLKAEPLHRFRLRSGEIAEIRKAQSGWYYVSKMKPSGYDIIVIQFSYREVPETTRKHRMEKWTGTQSGESKW